MGTYLFAHHFPKGYQGSPETAAAAAAWFDQLAPNLAGRTTPAAESRQLGDSGADPVPSAYEVITADDLEGAMVLAKAWPLLSRGGRLEVRELSTAKFRPPAATTPRKAGSNERWIDAARMIGVGCTAGDAHHPGPPANR